MSPEELVATQADPQRSALFTCDYCGHTWGNRISAGLCCDAISNDLGD